MLDKSSLGDFFKIGNTVDVLDFLMGSESYLGKRRISVSSGHCKPTEKHRHSLH
jgi:hypothetical protein